MSLIKKDSIIGMLIYIGLLALATIVVKYFFKTNIAVLTPSFAFLGIFLLSILTVRLTEGNSQTFLFNIWNVVVLIAIIVSIAICLKMKIAIFAVLWSLLFQLPYCLILYYYGGLVFTHKFD